MTPVDEYLAEQSLLQTPVTRIAGQAGAGGRAAFAELIPLSAPEPGQQYAFEVDLDACTGCKACVAACHSLNGLDEHETWRDVGLVVDLARSESFAQTVTTACHHCADPGCLNGCPVLAYEKDPVTGIVRHLDDQCIGCSYCVLKCPYEVPKYNPGRGIVRKCDMCAGRLAHGEAPACVQACPTEAIRIRVVPKAASDSFLPGAPDPAETRPTTRYLSSRPAQWAAAPTEKAPAPEEAHLPLALMTTLAGLGTGCTALAAFGGEAVPAARLWELGWVAGWAALAAGLAHLGQPLRAWRIFLGLRRSWMSREALLLALWAAAALALGSWGSASRIQSPAGMAIAGVGLAGLLSSVMIYVDTPRPAWAFAHTAPRFFGGALILPAAALAALGPARAVKIAIVIVVAVLVLKLAAEFRLLRTGAGPGPLRDSAGLLRGPLRRVLAARVAAAAAGAALLGAAPLALRLAGLAWLLLGEGMERFLFFRAAAAPRMPGVPRG